MSEDAVLDATPETAPATGGMLDLQSFEEIAPPTVPSPPSPTSQNEPTQPQAPKEEKPVTSKTQEATPQEPEHKEDEEKAEHPEEGEQPKKGGRDYGGLTDHETRLAKQMSKPAFDYFKSTISRVKEIEEENTKLKEQTKSLEDGNLPRSYYQHPQAYVLSKEYPQLLQNYRSLEFEQAHWEQQLINIRAGKDWEDLSYDQKTGQPISAGLQKPTPQAEVQVMKWMNNAGHQLSRVSDKIGTLQTSFKKQHEGMQQEIKDFIKAQHLDMFDNDKAEGNKIVKEVNRYLSDRGLDSDVLAPVIERVWTLAVLQQRVIAQLQQQNGKITKNAGDAKKAQPTASAFSGATTKAEKMLDLSDFGDDSIR